MKNINVKNTLYFSNYDPNSGFFQKRITSCKFGINHGVAAQPWCKAEINSPKLCSDCSKN